MPLRLLVIALLIGAGLTTAWPRSAAADAAPGTDAGAEAAIRETLLAWTRDFNRRDASRICDLFAPDLRYDYRGFPERDHAAVCALLRRSLADPARRFEYSPLIREILVSGDLAVVRLDWTLTVTPTAGGEAERTVEPGLDVFRRQPDGRWRIVRYLAYEAP